LRCPTGTWGLVAVLIAASIQLHASRSPASAADEAGKSWGAASSLPEPRWFARASTDRDGRIYVFGGWVKLSDSLPHEKGAGLHGLVIYGAGARRWERGPAPKPFEIVHTDRRQDGTWWRKPVPRDLELEEPCGAAGGRGRIHWFSPDGPVFFDPIRRAWDQPTPPVLNYRTHQIEGAAPHFIRAMSGSTTWRPTAGAKLRRSARRVRATASSSRRTASSARSAGPTSIRSRRPARRSAASRTAKGVRSHRSKSSIPTPSRRDRQSSLGNHGGSLNPAAGRVE